MLSNKLAYIYISQGTILATVRLACHAYDQHKDSLVVRALAPYWPMWSGPDSDLVPYVVEFVDGPRPCSKWFWSDTPGLVFIGLLLLSVWPFKIYQNTNQEPLNRLSPIQNLEKKERLSPRFISQQFFFCKICGYILRKFIDICMKKTCWRPSGWLPTWRWENNRKICHCVLQQIKSVNLYLLS